MGGKTASDIKGVEQYESEAEYISAQSDIASYKSGQTQSQAKALHTKNSSGISVLDENGNMTQEGLEMLTRGEQTKTAEQLKRSENFSKKPLMQSIFAQMVNSGKSVEERAKIANNLQSMGMVDSFNKMNQDGTVDAKDINPASAQSIARGMGEAQGNRLNDKMGGIILDGMGKEFDAVGTAVSSKENTGHTTTDGSSHQHLATVGDDQRLEELAKEKLGPNASKAEIKDYIHSQKEEYNRNKSMLNPVEDAAMMSSNIAAKVNYDKAHGIHVPGQNQGNPGHSNIIPDDSYFNPIENAVDGAIDFAGEWAPSVVGGVATTGLVYMTGKRIADGSKAVYKGLGGSLRKKTNLSDSTNDSKNSTNQQTTNKDNDSTGKSSGTHTNSFDDFKNYIEDYAKSQEAFKKESKNLASLEQQKKKMVADGKDTTAIDEKISDSKSKVSGFEEDMRKANSNLFLSKQMAGKEKGSTPKGDTTPPQTYEQLSQEFKEIGSQKRELASQFNNGDISKAEYTEKFNKLDAQQQKLVGPMEEFEAFEKANTKPSTGESSGTPGKNNKVGLLSRIEKAFSKVKGKTGLSFVRAFKISYQLQSVT